MLADMGAVAAQSQVRRRFVIEQVEQVEQRDHPRRLGVVVDSVGRGGLHDPGSTYV
jgi:hypothetical protein